MAGFEPAKNHMSPPKINAMTTKNAICCTHSLVEGTCGRRPMTNRSTIKNNASTTKVMISNASGVSAMIPYTNLCM